VKKETLKKTARPAAKTVKKKQIVKKTLVVLPGER
jgi:hypothetical protein